MTPFLEKYADPITKLLQVGLFIVVIGLLSTCFVESDQEKTRKDRKWNPTPENIVYWELKKTEWFYRRVCDSLKSDVELFETKGYFCEQSFSKVVDSARVVAELSGPQWFDMMGIPKEFRSIDVGVVKSNALTCQDLVRKWNNCPTGLSSEKRP